MTSNPIDMTYGDFSGDVTQQGFNETVGSDQTVFAGENLVAQPNKVSLN